MKRDQLLNGLRYIAASPTREHGGFHTETIAIAKSALRALTQRNLPRRLMPSDQQRDAWLSPQGGGGLKL